VVSYVALSYAIVPHNKHRLSVRHTLVLIQNLQGFQTEWVKTVKKGDFRSINRYISEMIEGRHLVTMEDQYKVAYGLLIGTNFDHLE